MLIPSASLWGTGAGETGTSGSVTAGHGCGPTGRGQQWRRVSRWLMAGLIWALFTTLPSVAWGMRESVRREAGLMV